MPSKSARLPSRSVQRIVLLPILCLTVVLLTLITVISYTQFEARVRGELVARSALVANAVRIAASTEGASLDLHRFVAAFGAYPDITLIVVVSESDERVVATTHTEWFGKNLEDLPEETVAEDIRPALKQRAASHTTHAMGDEFDYTLPLLLSQAEGAPERGVVMIHMEGGSIRASLRDGLIWTTILSGLGIFALLGVSWFLFQKYIARPLDRIAEGIDARRKEAGRLEVAPHLPRQIALVADRLNQAFLAARQHESSLRHMIQNLDQQRFAVDQHSIVTVTNTKGVITYANDRFCRISGFSRDEVLGQTHRIVNSGHHPAEFFSAMWKTISSGGVWRAEICNKTKNGQIYWVESTLLPLSFIDGKPSQYIGIRTDITELKRLETDLIAAKEAAEAATQAKSTFLATMSHEIRTPMNGLIGFTDLLLECQLEPVPRGYATTVKRSAEALLVLVNDILDYSKIEAGKLTLELLEIDPSEIAHGTLELMVRNARDKGLALILDVASDCPGTLLCDPTRLRQVLLNLVNNALKFTTQGSIRIRLSKTTVGQAQQVLQVDVIDTGIGIPSDKTNHLFERFTQADSSTTRRFGGTGLGLSISKHLIALMGGSIGVESRVGEGSRFWITLPLSGIAATPPAYVGVSTIDLFSSSQTGTQSPTSSSLSSPSSPQTTTPPTEATGIHALIVDDNDANRMLASALLQKISVSSEEATDGSTAVALASTKRFDIILMDCHMPNMDGCEATRAIRAPGLANSTTPIIALSASIEDRERCLTAGMNHFILKPIRKRQLQELVQTLLPLSSARD
jgi:PAS domain S-box-containing protein